MREFLQSSAGRRVSISLLVIAVLLAVIQVYRSLGPSTAGRLSRDRMFICSETKKPFEVTLKAGMKLPVHSPYSGKDTGYPAEACYWTRDGKVKKDPTWVLLNETVRQGGLTFCPDCGRLVVGHNPIPRPGDPPPPTESEYRARGGQ